MNRFDTSESRFQTNLESKQFFVYMMSLFSFKKPAKAESYTFSLIKSPALLVIYNRMFSIFHMKKIIQSRKHLFVVLTETTLKRGISVSAFDSRLGYVHLLLLVCCSHE